MPQVNTKKSIKKNIQVASIKIKPGKKNNQTEKLPSPVVKMITDKPVEEKIPVPVVPSTDQRALTLSEKEALIQENFNDTVKPAIFRARMLEAEINITRDLNGCGNIYYRTDADLKNDKAAARDKLMEFGLIAVGLSVMIFGAGYFYARRGSLFIW